MIFVESGVKRLNQVSLSSNRIVLGCTFGVENKASITVTFLVDVAATREMLTRQMRMLPFYYPNI
ncbi:hypothetical protein BvRS1_56950 [Burkholderia vietnamiensis]|nr:hypothetical protein BvRS1_56950 [Burkholderia vietnamiensis]